MKKTIIKSALATLLLSSSVMAGNCTAYYSNGAACYCTDGANSIASQSWAVNVASKDGSAGGNGDIDIGYCADSNDTACNEPRPTSLSNGSTLYLKNKSTGATDYFKCDVNHGTNMQSVAYTPPAPPPPASTAVPIGPFGLLALLAGILGSAFVGLRRKRA